MSKILSASCSEGKVTVEGFELEAPEILSEGVGESEGTVLLEGNKQFYIPKTSGDLKLTLEKSIQAVNKVGDTLTKISETLTAIGAGMTGPTTAPPGTLATDVATIVSNVAEITALTEELEELKENLK